MFLAIADMFRGLRRPARGTQPGIDPAPFHDLGPGPWNPAGLATYAATAAEHERLDFPAPPWALAEIRTLREQLAAAKAEAAEQAPAPKYAPLRPGGYPCPHCDGYKRVIRDLEDERKQLRARVARHELPATRELRLAPPGQPF